MSDRIIDHYDFNLEVPRGQISNMSVVHKFGRNTASADGTAEEVWNGSSAYPWASIASTANITHIKQTSDQSDLRGKTVQVQGLASGYVASTQTPTLDAANTTTAVALATGLLRVFRMEVNASATCTDSIVCQSSGATVYAQISTGENQTEMAIYTVPNGKEGYLTNYYATVNPGGGAPTTCQTRLWFRDNANSYAPKLKHTMGITGDVDAYGYFQHNFIPYYKADPHTDLYITATAAGAAVDISAGFDLILVDQ